MSTFNANYGVVEELHSRSVRAPSQLVVVDIESLLGG